MAPCNKRGAGTGTDAPRQVAELAWGPGSVEALSGPYSARTEATRPSTLAQAAKQLGKAHSDREAREETKAGKGLTGILGQITSEPSGHSPLPSTVRWVYGPWSLPIATQAKHMCRQAGKCPITHDD